MTRYVLEVPEHVHEEIFAHVLFIAQDSLTQALAWEARVNAAIAAIGEHPGYARDEAMSERWGVPVRRMVFERTYIVFYMVDESRSMITILHFRHRLKRPWNEERG